MQEGAIQLPEAEKQAKPTGPERRLHIRSFVFGMLAALAVVAILHLELPRVSVPTPRNIVHKDPALPTWLDAPLDYSKLALIIETRTEPQLIPLLLHFVMVVPPEWPFLFVGSEDNIATLRASDPIQRLERMHKIQFEHLDAKWPMRDAETVSQALTNVEFYDQYVKHAEHLLMWQLDSVLCANSQASLNDFLQYDYVGAPWWDNAGHGFGGNGGLSLRKMSRLRRVLREHPRPDYAPQLEDSWIVLNMINYPDHNVAPNDVEKAWVVESIWDDRPLGYHVGHDGKRIWYPHIWRNKEQATSIFTHCPEVKMILQMLEVAEDILTAAN